LTTTSETSPPSTRPVPPPRVPSKPGPSVVPKPKAYPGTLKANETTTTKAEPEKTKSSTTDSIGKPEAKTTPKPTAKPVIPPRRINPPTATLSHPRPSSQLDSGPQEHILFKPDADEKALRKEHIDTYQKVVKLLFASVAEANESAQTQFTIRSAIEPKLKVFEKTLTDTHFEGKKKYWKFRSYHFRMPKIYYL